MSGEYIVLQPIHLGNGEQGEARKRALEQIAEREGFTWGGNPSIGRWLINLADREIERMAQQVLDEVGGISRQVAPNATVGYITSTEGNERRYISIDIDARVDDDASETTARERAELVIDALSDAGYKWGWDAVIDDTVPGNTRMIVTAVNYG